MPLAHWSGRRGREERPGKGTVNCPDTTVPGPRKGKGQAFRDPVLRNHKGCCREGLWPSTQCTHGPTYTHANRQTHTQPEASTAGSCSTFGQELKGPLDARRLWQGALCQLLPPSRQGSEADKSGAQGVCLGLVQKQPVRPDLWPSCCCCPHCWRGRGPCGLILHCLGLCQMGGKPSLPSPARGLQKEKGPCPPWVGVS